MYNRLEIETIAENKIFKFQYKSQADFNYSHFNNCNYYYYVHQCVLDNIILIYVSHYTYMYFIVKIYNIIRNQKSQADNRLTRYLFNYLIIITPIHGTNS